jgi:Undecaprenyl-phosphate galactose phosphotransferase WbaP
MASDINTTAVLMATEHAASRISFSRPWKTVAALISSDALAVAISLGLASILRDGLFHSASYPVRDTIPPALLLLLCSFLSAGLYSGVSLDQIEEVRRLCLSVTITFLTLLSVTYFLHDLSLSRAVYVLAWALCLVTVPLFRALTRGALSGKSWWGSPVAILGYGSTGRLVLKKLQENPGIGLRPVAVLDDNPAKLEDVGERLVRGPLSECGGIAAHHKLSYGIVCMPHISREELLVLLALYGQRFGRLLVIPNVIGMTSLGISARNLGGIVGLEVRQELLRTESRLMKRALDMAITLLLVPVVLPVVAVTALLVFLEGVLRGEAGPILYKCDRIGRGGRSFKIWKLRSMVLNGDHVLRDYLAKNPSEHAHWNATQKLKRDPRLTRMGRIIRKTSIDELPQFWNVLIGEMSVVGPRPIQEDQIAMYGSGFSLYKQVRPGITGLWQVSGRNHLPFSERVNLDRYGIQNWSVWLDIYVLARTARVVITAEGAY